jgi:hypothetical protein
MYALNVYQIFPLGGKPVGQDEYFLGGLYSPFGGTIIKVVDEFGNPMSLVNVRPKGKSGIGGTTNSSGSIDISWAKPDDIIVFSFVGYGTVEVPFKNLVSGQTIQMEMSFDDLPPVVITKPKEDTPKLPVNQAKPFNWKMVLGISAAALLLLALLPSEKKPRKVNV